ncbi:hypothetical protein ALQ72_06708 [Pseudomonas syringae pv. maculicola]|nr:hypothetical protein ALQ72_06708 [Pseudomonas syringae pv. maculicola]
MRNDNLNHDHYRAALRVGMPFWTLRVLFCDAERHALHSHGSVRNDNLNHDHYRAALRVGMPFWTLRVLFCDAERHPLYSHQRVRNDQTSPTCSIAPSL